MPNWCENDLYISGPNLRKVLDFVKNDTGEEKTEFDFNKIIPMPDGLINTQSPPPNEEIAKLNKMQYGAISWYEWAHENWGTKWNAADTATSVYDRSPQGNISMVVHFSTAWAPPSPVIKKLSELFPENTFRLEFFECGCAFQGHHTYHAGKLEEVWEGQYSGPRGG